MANNDLRDDFLTELIVSMRQEIIIQKSIRNKMIVLKYIFLKTALIAVLVNISKLINADYVLTMLSVTVIYLDLIACQKSVAINRVGRYLKYHLEKYIAGCNGKTNEETIQETDLSEEFTFGFWETFFSDDRKTSKYSKFIAIFIGNISLSVGLVVLSVTFELIFEIDSFAVQLLLLILILGLIWDIILHLRISGIIGEI